MTGKLAMRLLVTAISTAGPPAHAELTAEQLAKLAQNPIADLAKGPFQNNTNFNCGPEAATRNMLNIQPALPVTINADWDLITRTIVPLIWRPAPAPNQATEFGLGDIQLFRARQARRIRQIFGSPGARSACCPAPPHPADALPSR